MPLPNLLQLLPTGLAAVGSLLQPEQDPQAAQREQLQALIEEIKGQFPDLEKGIRTREAVSRGAGLRRISDVGAAGRLPRNVILQRQNQFQLGSQRNLEDALTRLSQQKLGTLQNLAGIIGSLPPEQVDNTFQDLLGLSLQDLLGGGPISSFLGGLGQQQPGSGGVQGLTLQSPAVQKIAPGLNTNFQLPNLNTSQFKLPRLGG